VYDSREEAIGHVELFIVTIIQIPKERSKKARRRWLALEESSHAVKNWRVLQ
jgi:hypothetical protein